MQRKEPSQAPSRAQWNLEAILGDLLWIKVVLSSHEVVIIIVSRFFGIVFRSVLFPVAINTVQSTSCALYTALGSLVRFGSGAPVSCFT